MPRFRRSLSSSAIAVARARRATNWRDLIAANIGTMWRGSD
jgi:hypothetical protein